MIAQAFITQGTLKNKATYKQKHKNFSCNSNVTESGLREFNTHMAYWRKVRHYRAEWTCLMSLFKWVVQLLRLKLAFWFYLFINKCVYSSKCASKNVCIQCNLKKKILFVSLETGEITSLAISAYTVVREYFLQTSLRISTMFSSF